MVPAIRARIDLETSGEYSTIFNRCAKRFTLSWVSGRELDDGVVDRRYRLQISEDRLQIAGLHLSIHRPWHDGVEFSGFYIGQHIRGIGVHRKACNELVGRPGADTGLFVWCDVGG